MRILIVTGIFPPDSGGPATFVPLIAEALVKRQHEVNVLTLSDVFERPPTKYPFAVIRVHRSIPRLIRMCRVALQLITLGKKADVVFVNGLAFESAIAKFMNAKPIVQKIVGDFAWERATQKGWTTDEFETFQRRHSSWKVELLKRLQRWWIGKADRIIVPSNYLSSAVRCWGISAEKITTVYNAVVPEKRADGAADSGATRIITICRLVKWKRVDLIIKAVAEIPCVELVIVGDGPERESLKQLAKHVMVDKRVQFLGQIPQSQTPHVLARCHLFVLASTYEGFPHVVLEALRMGLPILATRAGGTPEVVMDGLNGKLVPTNDLESLVAALRVFVDNPDERARLAEGAARSSLSFDFQTMVSSVEAVLIAAAKEYKKDGSLPMRSGF